MVRQLQTKRGTITFPAFFPVTTFGGKFPLDELLRPHFSRFSPAMMVSHFYAQKLDRHITVPLFIDSGGFASIFKNSVILDAGEAASIRTAEGSILEPFQVFLLQQEHADVGATLDFVVLPDMDKQEALWRQQLTVRNALWTLERKVSFSLKLFASIQAWSFESAIQVMEVLTPYPFDGFALGGMVPRITNPDLILEITQAIRSVEHIRPLHVFGIGQPWLIRLLFDAGVDSVDSSSFVQQAVGKRYLHPETGTYEALDKVQYPKEICFCRVCQTFDQRYLLLEGELNTMALALHNLSATIHYLDLF